jgi:hypothetical protein
MTRRMMFYRLWRPGTDWRPRCLRSTSRRSRAQGVVAGGQETAGPVGPHDSNSYKDDNR